LVINKNCTEVHGQQNIKSNCLSYGVIFIVPTQIKIVAAGRIIQPGRAHFGNE